MMFTIGITTFDRPDHLRRCVDSIVKFYPNAPIIVADNGRTRAELPRQVRHLSLEYDCGLSASRNAMIRACDTDYVLVMEDDMYFTEETRLEAFVSLLDEVPPLGLVAGTLLDQGDLGPIQRLHVFDLFRDQLEIRPAHAAILRRSPSGIPYRCGDMVPNFFLARRDFLNDNAWDEGLKLGEHLAFFWEVYKARYWRVAHTDRVRVIHDRTNRSEEYVKMRSRAREMRNEFIQSAGLLRADFVGEPVRADLRKANSEHGAIAESVACPERPNVVVLGVGHSGTSILTRMLAALGWNLGDADVEFSESEAVRRINRSLEKASFFPYDESVELIRSFPRPWVIKDPRFARTLDRWVPVFEACPVEPLLVWIRRDEEAVVNSFRRRGAIRGRETAHVRWLYKLAATRFDRWPWKKIAIDFEHIADAVRLFDMERAGFAERSSETPASSCDRGPSMTSNLGSIVLRSAAM